jgi:hypothetical protein
LISIFLVECEKQSNCTLIRTQSLVLDISTSYVDRLHSNGSHGHSHSHSHPDPYLETYGHSHPNPHVPSDIMSHSSPDLTPRPTSSSSLVHHSSTTASYNGFATPSPAAKRPHPVHEPSSYFTGHHRHEPPGMHAGHRRSHPRATPGGLISFYGTQNRTASTRVVVESDGVGPIQEEDTEHDGGEQMNGHSDEDDHEDDVLSRKRQVVSILVSCLQLLLASPNLTKPGPATRHNAALFRHRANSICNGGRRF